ncbi:hypothetical protein D3C81_1758110 [compost metagenome]
MELQPVVSEHGFVFSLLHSPFFGPVHSPGATSKAVALIEALAETDVGKLVKTSPPNNPKQPKPRGILFFSVVIKYVFK